MLASLPIPSVLANPPEIRAIHILQRCDIIHHVGLGMRTGLGRIDRAGVQVDPDVEPVGHQRIFVIVVTIGQRAVT